MFFSSIGLYWRPILWAKKGHLCRAVYKLFFDAQYKHWEWKVRDEGRREGEVKCPPLLCVTECYIHWSYRISSTVSCRPFSLGYWHCLVCGAYSDLVSWFYFLSLFNIYFKLRGHVALTASELMPGKHCQTDARQSYSRILVNSKGAVLRLRKHRPYTFHLHWR